MVALNCTDLSVVVDSGDANRRRVGSRPTGRKAPSSWGGSSGSTRSSRPAHLFGSPDPSALPHPSGRPRPSSWVPAPSQARPAGSWCSSGQGPLSSCPAPVLPVSQRPRLMVVRDTPKREAHPTKRSDAASRRRKVFLWRRMLVVVVIAGLGAAALAAGGWLVQVAGAQPSRPPVDHVYVARPGDTIWGIAVKFSGGGDPRPLADELETQIGGGVLQPGEQLSIPGRSDLP
jgi:LysM repeat protein